MSYDKRNGVHWIQVWDEVEHESNAGVKYIHYKPILVQAGYTMDLFIEIDRVVINPMTGKKEIKTFHKPKTIRK